MRQRNLFPTFCRPFTTRKATLVLVYRMRKSIKDRGLPAAPRRRELSGRPSALLRPVTAFVVWSGNHLPLSVRVVRLSARCVCLCHLLDRFGGTHGLPADLVRRTHITSG